MSKVIYLQDREAGTHCYTPEMGDRKPECQMRSTLAYSGSHWFVRTPLQLKGRGIRFLKVIDDNILDKSMIGWNEYYVTDRAYEKLEKEYSIAHEVLLD